MKILVFVLLIIWLYLLSVFTRGKLYFAKFMVGAVGLFYFAMYFAAPYLILPLGHAVAAVSGILGNLSGYFEAFPQDSLIFISRAQSFISFYIDYECSGIVEIIAFLCLLWFFPVYNTAEKTIVSMIGIGWIFLAEVVRIFIICAIIYYAGNNVFYFANTVFGRIVFYAFSIVMYFYVFTKSHIVRQKVGAFSYDESPLKNGQ